MSVGGNDVKSLLIRILGSEFTNKPAIVGKVVGAPVGNTITVEAVEGKGTFENIRLQAHPGNGMLLIPKEGSFVVIVMMRQNSGYIALYSDVDSIKMLDGTFGGLIKINDLVSRLVEYEDAFDQLQSDFNTWVPVANDGGAALKTVLGTGFLTITIPNSTAGDFENDKITHGDP